ncbi:hypothetical protein B2G71_15040 [Novosphingobium sp. PC22D]|uniref:spinster family MFS transporter n=1 Tax=Novosphingobium sp. PC22D TaxID=1962403 RepID=UPI000BF21E58|nr:MFS transporter [Novosphingobium sp. PC22D]PEQ11766.1 hypothetical protein B2G71_15040 [Novosphingobium sp. PC22D]
MSRPLTSPDEEPYSKAYLWYVVGLLALVNAVNLMDRLVFSVMMPAIKAELQLSDTQLGLLSGFAFAALYATLGIPIAAYADRSVRRNIVGAALIIWSAMTALCGLAQNLLHLTLARVGVGIGEAGCLPPSHSMITDFIPAEWRSRALGIITAGGSLGSIAGLIVGGWLVAALGWRGTFLAMGVPGVLLGVIVFLTLREPARTRNPAPAPAGREGDPATIIELIRARPVYLQLVLAIATSSFFGYGMQQWLPSFYMRSYGLTIAQVGLLFGLVSGTASILGTIAGGYVGDRLYRRGVGAVLLYGIACTVLTALLKLATVVSTTQAASLAFNFGGSLFSSAFLGPAFALVQILVPPGLRARAVAVLTFFVSLLGTGAGPLFVGVLSDVYASAGVGKEALRTALTWCCLLGIWPIVHLWLARKALGSATYRNALA